MCVENTMAEKCKICKEKDQECVYVPIMTSEEAAEIITEYENLTNNDKTRLYRVGNEAFLIGKKEWEENGILYLESALFRRCMFYDEDKKECKIYTHRPQMCRDLGTSKFPCAFTNMPVEQMEKLSQDDLGISFVLKTDFKTYIKNKFGNIDNMYAFKYGFKNIPNVPDYSKGNKYRKLLKTNTENLILYNIINFIYAALENENLKEKREVTIEDLITGRIKYKLLTEDNGKRTTTAVIREYSSERFELKPYVRVLNRLMYKFVMMPNDYLEVIYNKSVKLAKILDNRKNCVDPEILDNNKRLRYLIWLLSSVLLLEIYKNNFKLKSKEYNNLITSDEILTLKKFLVTEIQKELGLEVGYSFKVFIDGFFKCLFDSIVAYYKNIMSTSKK